MAPIRYDLELFNELNAAYADRPLVPKVRTFVHADLFQEAEGRAKSAAGRLSLRGKRVLEIGTGRGHLAAVLARDYDCDVVGVDIRQYDSWPELRGPRVDLRVHDISDEKADNSALGTFDCALSIAVWEHIEHPYAALRSLRSLLRPGGRAFVSANLYRGPKASHRYREVYFPWPHLLFEDEVFRQFYAQQGRPTVQAAWVNKLTAAHYYQYLRQLDFTIEKEWFSVTPVDEEFYQRFIDKLGRYPRSDLERDFINLLLSPGVAKPPATEPAPVTPRGRPSGLRALVRRATTRLRGKRKSS